MALFLLEKNFPLFIFGKYIYLPLSQ